MGLVALGPSSTAEADPDCRGRGFYIVFVRGSGEKIYDKRAKAFHDQVMAALWRPPMTYDYSSWVEIGNLDGDTPPGESPNESSEYPAVNAAWATVMPPVYYNSVGKGVDELTAHLNDRARRCPNESIILGGYSQGAHVIGWTLQLGGLTQTAKNHIGYVALYGDPRFNPGRIVDRQNHNNFTNHWWVRGDDTGWKNVPPLGAFSKAGILGMRSPYISEEFKGRFGSWCAYGDGICSSDQSDAPNFPVHSSAYDGKWIADSAGEIASRATAKRNELNPSSPPMEVLPYTITNADGVGVTPETPPPPVVKSIKRTFAPNGVRQVYAATKSAVTEAWWEPGGDGVHNSEIIHIAQDNIVGFDKVNEPDGVTQSLYTAVPDGVWESWWRPGEGIHHNKIVTGLSGVRQVIADPQQESAGYTHRLYVLAQDGPYEVWWRDGGDGVHVTHLDSINDPVTMTKSKGPDGIEQLYVATPTWVYELWWHPGENSVHTGSIINITQGNIKSLSKAANSADGKQRLYTGTTTGVWESSWGGGVNLSHNYIVSGQTNAVQVEKNAYNGVDQLYLATGDHVQEYWWTPSNGGGSTLINISQNNVTAMDKVNDGENQAVYTASGDLVYETWWRAGNGPNTSVLMKVQR
jgi:hypothetical protein